MIKRLLKYKWINEKTGWLLFWSLVVFLVIILLLNMAYAGTETPFALLVSSKILASIVPGASLLLCGVAGGLIACGIVVFFYRWIKGFSLAKEAMSTHFFFIIRLLWYAFVVLGLGGVFLKYAKELWEIWAA